jgi:hypothetical protein
VKRAPETCRVNLNKEQMRLHKVASSWFINIIVISNLFTSNLISFFHWIFVHTFVKRDLSPSGGDDNLTSQESYDEVCMVQAGV